MSWAGQPRTGRPAPSAVLGEGVARGPVAIFWDPRQSPSRGSREGRKGAVGAGVGARGRGGRAGGVGQGGHGGSSVLPKDWRFWIVDMRY